MKLSVLMAVYPGDDPRLLGEALDSLARQTTPAAEIVLVEDGPLTPALAAVIDAYRGRLPVVSLRRPRTEGLGAALADGLAACRFELVARMDADDIALPERFRIQMDRLSREPSIDILGCQMVEIDIEGKHGRRRRAPVEHDSIHAALWRSSLFHPTIMARTARLRMVGGYDRTLARRQDYELWFRCAAAGLRFANVDEELLLYRMMPQSMRKQTFSGALRQGLIGFRGSRAAGLPLWKQVACFYPAARALLPSSLAFRLR